MAATRLIALHKNKGKTVEASLKGRIDYATNEAKMEFISTYQCTRETMLEEWLLQLREYEHKTGRRETSEVLAYQIRQSFKPGEVSAKEANEIGYELAKSFTKGKHAFFVATHTDRHHIHNHILFSAVELGGERKFKDFYRSGLAVQKVSDRICLEHGLSIVEPGERATKNGAKWSGRVPFRQFICMDIERALEEHPKDWDAFLAILQEYGYNCKSGKHFALKGPGQSCFIRLCSLGDGYSEVALRSVIAGEQPFVKRMWKEAWRTESQTNLLVDIQVKLRAGKTVGYERWAKVFNVKQMAKTMAFLQEQGIGSLEELDLRKKEMMKRVLAVAEEIKNLEDKLKETNVDRDILLQKKRALSAEYWKLQKEIKELLVAMRNVEMVLGGEERVSNEASR